MFHALLRAPMRFFDTNPSGRVLNRFSKDMGAIDEFLPRALMDAVQIMLVLCGILALVLIANYYMIVPLVILGAVFLKIRSSYITTARNIKNLEGISKACQKLTNKIVNVCSYLSKIACIFSSDFFSWWHNDHSSIESRSCVIPRVWQASRCSHSSLVSDNCVQMLFWIVVGSHQCRIHNGYYFWIYFVRLL